MFPWGKPLRDSIYFALNQNCDSRVDGEADRNDKNKGLVLNFVSKIEEEEDREGMKTATQESKFQEFLKMLKLWSGCLLKLIKVNNGRGD